MIAVCHFVLYSHSPLQYEQWNGHYRKLLGYIKTRSKPPILYVPALHTPDTEELLKKSQTKIEGGVNLDKALPDT